MLVFVDIGNDGLKYFRQVRLRRNLREIEKCFEYLIVNPSIVSAEAVIVPALLTYGVAVFIELPNCRSAYAFL